MDIQRWLNETVEAGPLPSQDQTVNSAFFHPKEKSRPVFKERHARKRAKSDSSLLVPQPHMQTASPKKPNPLTEEEVDAAVHSEASRPSRNSSTESESFNHRYARRPRRKTRPERYEPQQNKERGKHTHQSRKGESKKPSRKSKRRGGEKSDSGIAQNFHAKNVSRDRLTLKPREPLGIFNKGKTSTAVRGRGLPDLVFSEMRFLQREKVPPESAPQQGASKKKRKKDHARTKEGEISAFFTSVRPVLAEKDNNVPPAKVGADEDIIATTGHREREPSIKSSGVVPTIELSGRGAYLGFGSRGPRHESTSYVSWSESVRTPDMTPRRPKQLAAIGHDRHETSKHRRVGSTTSGAEHAGFKLSSLPRAHKHRRDESTEHFQISSMALPQNRVSRSQSYPQRTLSPQKLDLVDRNAKFQSTESVDSPSSMPPFVAKASRVELARCEPGVSSKSTQREEVCRSAVENIMAHRPSCVEREGSVDAVRQDTSSDLGKVIQHCNHTFHGQRRATEPQRGRLDLYSPHVSNEVRRHDRSAAPVRRPTVRFSEVERPVPRVPNFSGRSFYEEQTQRTHIPLEEVLDDEEFRNDPYLPGQKLEYGQGSMVYEGPDWEEHFEEPAPYGAEYEVTDFGLEVPETLEERVQRIRSDNSVVTPGFWRPNRLY